MDNIKDAIRKLAQQDGETVALVCTVDAVDKKARTIDCTPVNEGAPLLGVNLQANQGSDFGLVIYPEKGGHISDFDRQCQRLCKAFERILPEKSSYEI